MDSDVQNQFMYLFERIGEPLYFGPRGKNNTYYDVPMDSLDSRTKHAAQNFRQNMLNSTTASHIAVSKPRGIPDLKNIGAACPKTALFCYFLPTHRNAAFELKKILMAQSSREDFLSMSCICRDSELINPRLWIYAFASSVLERPDLKGFRMPAIWEVIPDQFISPSTIRMAQRQIILPEQDRSLITVDQNFTGNDTNPESRLNYFREDLGINSHHWHWHLVYPTEATVNKRDRKGELFYYMHHSMLARYEAERLSMSLQFTRPFDLTGQLDEGYFPKLYQTTSGIIWGGRQESTRMQTVDRLQDPNASFAVALEDIFKWRDRINAAIDTGIILNQNGQNEPLSEERGIDILGDIIEAADISPNVRFYGNFHNMGHVVMACSHDPFYRHREQIGVIGDNVTAMRDPAFYRFHKYVDQIFDKYLGTLTPYTSEQLIWQGITLTDISVQTAGRRTNLLITNWMQSDIDLSRGLDFGRYSENNLGAVWARITHLNNENFTYRIAVQNSLRRESSGTIRIFMAPRHNDRGQRLDMTQQRLLFFEMDKFTFMLRPGENIIERQSTSSSITIPWEQTFRDLERTRQIPTAEQSICGCGWPQHMLLPRGTVQGMAFDLYVIVTDGAKDLVQRKSSNGQTEAGKQGCRDSVSYCGLLNELYPDAKKMGYPFDRYPRLVDNRPISNLDGFVRDVPNSRTIQVTIQHENTTTIRPGGAPMGMTRVNGGSQPSSPTGSRPASPTPIQQPGGRTPTTTSRPSSPGRRRNYWEHPGSEYWGHSHWSRSSTPSPERGSDGPYWPSGWSG